ncbi:MED14 [Cordylochernes scorpioides]|uniref:Mediator of RNA polymerase II transcription subunit 14 n=1 Tax=Cordylochernes scorpioides TaxID=51811 RepID=A0ABY6KMT0_9ARAC|nr:MED14 [Cordylochernes scorpioides]
MCSMAPVEGHQTTPQQVATIPQPSQGSIPLPRLIDFLLQKTYTDLTLLAELLPRKTDMERKIEIANFSHRIRQQYIRLLALIKWAASANKVEKCSQITAFLDKQSMLFVETADMLAMMARDTLVHARLPSFHIPSAVEVLTLGTYSRLPACIREKIVPPDPITPKEKAYTLSRLNQIIEYRLVSTDLPIQMRNLEIENGCVTFLVEHEFKVSLTLMGDGPTVPWRLLDIVILVEDKETGVFVAPILLGCLCTDGKSLVHSQQIRYLLQLIQSRMVDNPRALHDLYSCLHSFCLSLQLEVLHSQVSQYRLVDCQGGPYKLGVAVEDPALPLQVRHQPPLSVTEAATADQAIRSDRLSMEKLLVHTVHLRARHCLTSLSLKLDRYTCSIHGTPAILQVSLFPNAVSSENLLITVDTHTGEFLAHVPQYEPPMIDDIQDQLNKNPTNMEALLTSLKKWLVLRRCEKTVQHLPVMVMEQLPLVVPPGHPVETVLSKERLFLRLSRHHGYYVVVELQDLDSLAYYLLAVQPQGPEESYVKEEEPTLDLPDYSKSFLRIVDFLRLDAFSITHGPCTQVEGGRPSGLCAETVRVNKLKRKLSVETSPSPPPKKPKFHSQYIPELGHVVALCDEMLPFTQLGLQLYKHGVCHQATQVEADGFTYSIRIVKMPDIDGLDPETMEAFHQALLSTTICMHAKGTRAWLVEFVFGNCPVVSLNSREGGARRPVTFYYEYSPKAETMVQEMVQDWGTMGHLYQVVLGLANSPQDHRLFEIRSYTYKKLILGYGPQRANTVTITWRPADRRFHLSFAVVSQTNCGSNPHLQIVSQIQHEFNEHRSIPTLMQVLNDTYSPLLSLNKLPTAPQLGVVNSRPQIPVQSFVLVPQTSTHYRVVYRQLFCIDIQCRPDNHVAIKDGAFSIFDKSKVIEEFVPIQTLKTFLNKVVDDPTSHLRRRSQSEDDNPLSPGGGMECIDTFLLGGHKPGSPATMRQDGGLRFHMPMTPPSGSNPHTPASPHPSVLSQPNYGASPNPSFSLASPPSQQYVTPSPSMQSPAGPGLFAAANSPVNPLHVPSPSFLPTASPSPAFEGGSPFPAGGSLSMSSPAAWPGSPSVPRPSPRGTAQSPGASMHSPQAGLPPSADHKVATGGRAGFPQAHRILASTVPVLVSHKGLDFICSPSPLPVGAPTSPAEATLGGPGAAPVAPLERMLGCMFLRRVVHRVVTTDEAITVLPSADPGTIYFKVETLQLKLNFNLATLQSLHLKATPAPEYKEQWSDAEIHVLERYCDLKVFNAPYKPNAFHSLSRLLNAPIHVLKSCLLLLRLELLPDRNLKWSVQWCFTIPPASPPMGPVGMSGIILKEKMLFFSVQLQLTRMGLNLPPGVEPMSVVVPLVYELNSNTTSLADRNANNPPFNNIRSLLKRFTEMYPQSECSIFPAIRDVMANLAITM